MIFDFSDGDFIMPMGNHLGMDFDGNLNMRMGNNMSMDLDSGDIHLTSSWKHDDDNNNSHSSLFGGNGLFDDEF